jgi:hypothetical protein
MSDKKDEQPVLQCPNCKDYIIILKINCGIFRHGIFINSGNQINPHSSKELCDNYIQNKLIYGCGKPFKVIFLNDKFEAEICDYI